MRKMSKKTEMGLVDGIKAAWVATDKAQLLVQCVICLMPIIAGIIAYDRLPETMATHWGFGNEPNGWMPRLFVIVGLPVLMAMMQLVCVLTTEGAMLASREEKATEDDGDANSECDSSEEVEPYRPKKLLLVAYWIIPIITVVLYVVTVAYNLGQDIPVGKVALALLALVFILCGNYSQKLPYSMARVMTNPVPKDERSYRRYAKVCAYGMISIGLACLVGMLLV